MCVLFVEWKKSDTVSSADLLALLDKRIFHAMKSFDSKITHIDDQHQIIIDLLTKLDKKGKKK